MKVDTFSPESLPVEGAKHILWGHRVTPPWAISIALSVTLALGLVDYLTGRDLVMSAFYLAPICWLTWNSGRNAGMLLAAVCAGVWLVADFLSGYTYSHPVIPYWNAFVLWALYGVIVWLLSALRHSQDRLETTVERRTEALRSEIAERKRLEARRIQAERLAVVGTMAAEMAHEVRNPLGAIALNLDLIQKEIGKLAETSRHLPQEGGVLVNDMREEVHPIQHVLEDYLQFARVPKLQRRPVELGALLSQKLAFMNGSLEHKGIALRTSFDPSLKSVSADPDQLWQATLNLIRNGIEATPEGGEVTVSTRFENGEACIGVADTGSGMNAEQIQQVYIPFYSTKLTGTGLGLALVQQIMIEHGGHVECESAPGKGSAFTLFLPLMEKS
ncbi:MAG: ATP-binding protein [Chthoniobacter sp.]|uniref:sensor histidine kinase n=1 Tax=Chthoniobacter sp. TaxID=2510640 RepID=UPI0032A576FC